MARTKFKMTGFARFFFAMLILAPLAYIGASYANGEDGIENFKNLFKGKISMGSTASEEGSSTQSETTKTVDISSPSAQSTDTDLAALKAKDQKIYDLEQANQQLQEALNQNTDSDQTALEAKNRTINDLKQTNQQLQDSLAQKTKELEEVKAQLKTIRDAIGN